jgi:hypothetical protein
MLEVVGVVANLLGHRVEGGPYLADLVVDRHGDANGIVLVA